ncbi:hypothetical protein [Nannocystis pusilla]|uniref:hypothetical protein n=1 Tax=Nannocystis pusilla TaxID=889268 RepID=UPI003DA1DB62
MLLSCSLVALSVLASRSPEADLPFSDASDPVAVITGWTPHTPNEAGAAICDVGSAVDGLRCRGPNCEEIRLHCLKTNYTTGTQTTIHVSAGNLPSAECPANAWVTSLTCSGEHCNNIFMDCREFAGVKPTNCVYSEFVSGSSGGEVLLYSGYYLRGLECEAGTSDHGGVTYCERLSLYSCKMTPEG